MSKLDEKRIRKTGQSLSSTTSWPIPEEERPDKKKKKRRPTPADAAIDYVSYLLDTESEEDAEEDETTPRMKGQSLIDDFINNDKGKIKLKDNPNTNPQ